MDRFRPYWDLISTLKTDWKSFTPAQQKQASELCRCHKFTHTTYEIRVYTFKVQPLITLKVQNRSYNHCYILGGVLMKSKHGRNRHICARFHTKPPFIVVVWLPTCCNSSTHSNEVVDMYHSFGRKALLSYRSSEHIAYLNSANVI